MKIAELKYKVLSYPNMGTELNSQIPLLYAKLCYAPLSVDELSELGNPWTDKDGKFVQGLIRSGHLGALEHWNTTFAVEGFSRISSQQNDRHRLAKIFQDSGVSYVYESTPSGTDISQLQQSQRYVPETDIGIIVPDSIHADQDLYFEYLKVLGQAQQFQAHAREKGVPAEDARFALPNAVETRFVVTTNARQLRHMFNLRCCTRAQWEIRNLFNGLLSEYQKIAPDIFWNAGASCVDLGYCPEGKMSCGAAPTIAELKAAYSKEDQA